MIKYTLVSALCLFLNCQASVFDQSKAQQILMAVNQIRQQAGKGALCLSSKLASTAMQQSNNQASQDLLTHENPSFLLHRYLSVGFRPLRADENIAQTESMDPAKVMEAWIASQDYRGKILRDHSHMGVAAASSLTGKIYWTAHFGKAADPMEVCDYVPQLSGSASQTTSGTLPSGSASQTASGTLPSGSASQATSGTQPSGNAPSPSSGIPSGTDATSSRKLCVKDICYEIKILSKGASFVQTPWRPPSGHSIAGDPILF